MNKNDFLNNDGWNFYKIDNKCDIELRKGTKIARYYVQCFDRDLVLLLNDYNLTNKDIGEIEMQLDKNYTDWCTNGVDDCCEEFMINNLDKYYRNCIVAVLYGGDEEDE